MQWPSMVNTDSSRGITWLELFLDWAFHSRNLPPVMCGARDTGLPASYSLPSPEWHLSPKNFTAWLQGFVGLVKQLARLTNSSPLPCIVTRKVTPLSALGDSECRRGLLQRPALLAPGAVYAYLVHLPPRKWSPATLTTAVLHSEPAPAWPVAAVTPEEWHSLSAGRRRALAATTRSRAQSRPLAHASAVAP